MTVDPGPLDPNWGNEIAIYSGFQIPYYMSFFIRPESNKIYHAVQHFQDTRGAQLPRNLQLFAADDLLEAFKGLFGMKKM